MALLGRGQLEQWSGYEEVKKSGHEINVIINNVGYFILILGETFAKDEICAQIETIYFCSLC